MMTVCGRGYETSLKLRSIGHNYNLFTKKLYKDDEENPNTICSGTNKISLLSFYKCFYYIKNFERLCIVKYFITFYGKWVQMNYLNRNSIRYWFIKLGTLTDMSIESDT